METPAFDEVADGTALGDACSLVTRKAERLLLMAARAARAVLARRLGVQRQEVVRMRLARAHATVVAISAVLLAVAAGAKTAVVSGDRAVPHDPIGPVARIFEPARRHELCVPEARLQARTEREMTRAAFAARAFRWLRVERVAADASLHAR